MRWRDGRRSQNVEDVRGRSGRGLGRGATLGGGTLVLLVAAWFLGVDPRMVMGLVDGGALGGTAQTGPEETTLREDDPAQYAATVLAFTEDVWTPLFARAGERYAAPTLRLFSGADVSGCGQASSAMGPFYCPADRKVYIDLDFFQELVQRFGGPGDAVDVGSFAQAYVIAHEVGHHVQTLTGISDQVHSQQSRAGEQQGNALQVRMELQADCYAGVWAHHDKDRLTSADIESGLAAAAAVGDDMIQKKMQGYVVPESFTHGSAEQRQRWFSRGFASGEPADCDTFAAPSL